MAGDPDSFDLAASELRSLDRTRYFATLVLPEPARRHVQAVYAYAAELDAVRSRVTEPGLGEIRLQWWIDTLNGAGQGAGAANPVADALIRTIQRFGFSTHPFEAMAEAHRFDLYDDPMPDMNQFEGYAGETVSLVYQHAALIVNEGRDAGSADAAGHLGVAEALCRALLEMPADLARGRVCLPQSIFAQAGVSQADLLAGRETPELQAACTHILDFAGDHIDRTQQAVGDLPRPVRPVFAPLAVTRLQAKRLQRRTRHPLADVQPVPDWRKLAALFGWAVTR